MPFTLTAHAAFEMERRQIPLAWVESVFYSPEQVLAGQGGRVIHQSRVLADGKVYLVRLVLEPHMKADYDRSVDILTLTFSAAPVEESDEIRPGVIVDYDAQGNVVGFEILNASLHVPQPAVMEFAVKVA